MNSLTINMHLLLSSFYRPTEERRLIITDTPTFPSDLYALRSQIHLARGNPEMDLVAITPREGEVLLRMDDIAATIAEYGERTALVWFNGVNFLTGQLYDLESIASWTHDVGALFGADLAHAVGNVPLRLHDWRTDFAVWCHYKYLNAGPGAVGGAYVHQRHYEGGELPRLAGWWGDTFSRCLTRHTGETYSPQRGANGWQVSTPSPIQAKLLEASLVLFEEAGMDALRRKSIALTANLEEGLQGLGMRQLTPRDRTQRGAQLTYAVEGNAESLQRMLRSEGIVCDVRAPNLLRLAPCPLYNTFSDVEKSIKACGNNR